MMLDSHEIEDVVERFRDWLAVSSEDLRAGDVEELAEQLAHRTVEPTQNGGVGLLQVVETMTALRQDLKLQSKGVRSLREATEAALEGLHRATEQVESCRQDAAVAAERAVRPLIDKLVTLDELIGQAAESIAKTASRPRESVPEGLLRDLDAAYSRLPRWKRLATAGWQRDVRGLIERYQPPQEESHLRQWTDGLRMLRTRSAAALEEVGIERITCVDRAVDPTSMRVVDVVDGGGRPPETVVEEVRPGYRYQGEVIRCAEVRATRAT